MKFNEGCKESYRSFLRACYLVRSRGFGAASEPKRDASGQHSGEQRGVHIDRNFDERAVAQFKHALLWEMDYRNNHSN